MKVEKLLASRHQTPSECFAAVNFVVIMDSWIRLAIE